MSNKNYKINDNPSKLLLRGVCVNMPFDFSEMKKRERNKQNSNIPRFTNGNSTDYSIKKGDLVFFWNGSDSVFSVLDNISLDEYDTSDKIINAAKFAGVANENFDPVRNNELSVLVSDTFRLSFGNKNIKTTDFVGLSIPEFKKKGDVKNGYFQRFPGKRLIFSLKKINREDHKELHAIRHKYIVGLTSERSFKNLYEKDKNIKALWNYAENAIFLKKLARLINLNMISIKTTSTSLDNIDAIEELAEYLGCTDKNTMYIHLLAEKLTIREKKLNDLFNKADKLYETAIYRLLHDKQKKIVGKVLSNNDLGLQVKIT